MSIYFKHNRNLSESQHSPTSSNMDPPPPPPWQRSLPPLNPNPFALMRANMEQATILVEEMAGFVKSIETRLVTIHPLFKDAKFKVLPEYDGSLGSRSSVSPTTREFWPQQAYDPVKGAEEDGEGYDPRKPGTGQTLRTEKNIGAYHPKKPATGHDAPTLASSGVQLGCLKFSIFGVPLGNQRGIPNEAYWDGEGFVDPPPTASKRKHAQSYPIVSNPPAKKRKAGTKQEAGEDTAKYWPKGWPKGWPRSFDSGTMSGYMASGEDSPEQPKAPRPTAIGLGISGVRLHDISPVESVARQLEKKLGKELLDQDDDTGIETPIYVTWEEMQETSDSHNYEDENWGLEPREQTPSGPEAFDMGTENFEFDYEEFREVTDNSLLSQEEVEEANYGELKGWEQGEYHEPLSPVEGYNTRRVCFKCGEDSVDGHLERACQNQALSETKRQRVIQEWKAKFQKGSQDSHSA